MMSKHSLPCGQKRCNGHHPCYPVEPLSARLRRLRLACRYSVFELAAVAQVLPSTIQLLEAGKATDKRGLASLAVALRVPLCYVVCGEHNCADRACVREPRLG